MRRRGPRRGSPGPAGARHDQPQTRRPRQCQLSRTGPRRYARPQPPNAPPPLPAPKPGSARSPRPASPHLPRGRRSRRRIGGLPLPPPRPAGPHRTAPQPPAHTHGTTATPRPRRLRCGRHPLRNPPRVGDRRASRGRTSTLSPIEARSPGFTNRGPQRATTRSTGGPMIPLATGAQDRDGIDRRNSRRRVVHRHRSGRHETMALRAADRPSSIWSRSARS
jgi:hypothetical protein